MVKSLCSWDHHRFGDYVSPVDPSGRYIQSGDHVAPSFSDDIAYPGVYYTSVYVYPERIGRSGYSDRAGQSFEHRQCIDDVQRIDRKSTRLNSSHVAISYAVFCLKKKNTHTETIKLTVTTESII